MSMGGRLKESSSDRQAGHVRAQLFRQLLVYGGIGLISNGAGYLVYLGLTGMGAPPKLAMSCLYGVGVLIGFFGNRTLTFSHQGRMGHAAWRFFVAHLGGYLINLSLLLCFSDWMGYPHQWVQAIAIFIVAAYLFVAMRVFVFRTRYDR